MDRTLPTFKEAEDRVKISHFTKQGYDITGLVHVGANDGYEIEFYLAMGIKPILAFEPLDSARKILWQKYKQSPDVLLFDVALGNLNGMVELMISEGDGKQSSVLKEIRPQWGSTRPSNVFFPRTQLVTMKRLADYRYPIGPGWCLVIDAQGMELDVLRGLDEYITLYDFICVEVSKVPIYRGEASGEEVWKYLVSKGFFLNSEIPDHDDAFFINGRVLHPPAPEKPVPNGDKLNIGSGQRRFEGHGWINIDAVSRPGQVPDLILDAGKEVLPYPDNSMECAVLHQVYEHFGCGEGHALIKEIYRVLRPDGFLIVTVPNMKNLAQRWLEGGIEDFIFMVNTYGAYQGYDSDRHKWGYYGMSLKQDLAAAAQWKMLRVMGGDVAIPRVIPGADIARDWWILEVEAYK